MGIYLWINTYFVLAKVDVELTMFWSITNIFIYVTILVPGCILAEAFHEFEACLWTSSEKHMDNVFTTYDDAKTGVYYNHLTDFACKHPIDAKILNLSFCGKNIFKLVITFVIAKLISYSVTYFYVN